MSLVVKLYRLLNRIWYNRPSNLKKIKEANNNIEKRLKEKSSSGQKINILFVCHRPQLWSSFDSIFQYMVKDDSFKVTMVTIPNKKQIPGKGLRHEVYESEGAEEYFDDFPCEVIKGYDYEKKTWIDLKQFSPDYVFFQVPYDICRPKEYQSDIVSKYARICYINYGMPFMNGMVLDESTPEKYIRNSYFCFAESDDMQSYYANKSLENAIHKRKNVINTGYPKFDNADSLVGCESDSWQNHNDKLFRVMWTPRWNTEEENCTFFELKDYIIDYFENNNDCELLFRPHPQAFLEYIARGEMTEEEVADYKKRFEMLKNASIDNQKQYLPSFYSTDVLVSDESSIIPEYFLTGKPMIFTYKETHFLPYAKKMAEGFYWAKSWDEVNKYIEMLKNGNDPLKEKRQELIKEIFVLPEGGSGKLISEIIKEDFNR